MLEGQVTHQQVLVTLIHKLLTNLGVVSINRVKIYGRQQDDEFPAWIQEFELELPSPSTLSLNSSLPINSLQNSYKENLSSDSNSAKVSETNSKARQAQNFNSSNRLDALDIILLALLGILVIVSIASSLGGFIFIAILALIPAQIAKEKGRKPIRWYCYGFYNFFIALIILLIIKSPQELAKKQYEAELQRGKQAEEKEKYLLLLDPTSSPVKFLKTNLAPDILKEFRKVQARVSVGVSYNE